MAARQRIPPDTAPPGPAPRPPVVFTPDSATQRLPVPGPVRPGPALTPVEPAQSSFPLWLLGLGIFAGAALALLTIPAWVPTLAASLVGADVKASWYLSRAAGLVAFVLLWASMVSGLFITNKMARVWPGAFTAFDLHQFTSLLGLGFAVFHALILLFDTYITYNLLQLLVPFAASSYRPLWVGLGQSGLYLLILVTFTFYVRKQIGNRLWHVIHLFSYLVFALALAHGVLSGTDSGNVWLSAMYWLGGLSLLALTIHRLMVGPGSLVRQ